MFIKPYLLPPPVFFNQIADFSEKEGVRSAYQPNFTFVALCVLAFTTAEGWARSPGCAAGWRGLGLQRQSNVAAANVPSDSRPFTIGPQQFAPVEERPPFRLVGQGNVRVLRSNELEPVDFPLANPGTQWGISHETNYKELRVGSSVVFRDGVGTVLSRQGNKIHIRNPNGREILLELDSTFETMGYRWQMEITMPNGSTHKIELLDGIHGDRSRDFSRIYEIRDLLEQMPVGVVQSLQRLRVQNAPYRDSNALATASVPDGIPTMDIYLNPRVGLDLGISTFTHEYGHLFAYSRFSSFMPPNAWVRAMRRDGQSVSRYADSNTAEDFAETFVAYLMAGNNPGMRRRFGNRFAELDQLMERRPEVRRNILRDYRNALAVAGIGVVTTASGFWIYQGGAAYFYAD